MNRQMSISDSDVRPRTVRPSDHSAVYETSVAAEPDSNMQSEAHEVRRPKSEVRFMLFEGNDRRELEKLKKSEGLLPPGQSLT